MLFPFLSLMLPIIWKCYFVLLFSLLFYEFSPFYFLLLKILQFFLFSQDNLGKPMFFLAYEINIDGHKDGNGILLSNVEENTKAKLL